MKTFWTQGMKPEEKDEFKQKYLNSEHVRQVLAEKLRENIRKIQKDRLSPQAADNPNWALNQAQLNAEEKVYHKIIDLIVDK